MIFHRFKEKIMNFHRFKEKIRIFMENQDFHQFSSILTKSQKPPQINQKPLK